MLKRILILSFILAMVLWISGCQQEVKHERHESTIIEDVESEEIVIDGASKAVEPANEQHESRTIEKVESEKIVIE